MEQVDIAIIGAGAAGLFAAIWAGREARAQRDALGGVGNGAQGGVPLRIVALDGARKLGAKVLVAGGGRCNVTHHAVDETAYAGSSRNAIRQVLRAFTVEQTRAFFAELGVTLKREETGKLFPTTDDAHTVLDALLAAAKDAGAELRHPWRVGGVTRREDGLFVISHAERDEKLLAARVILATGGMALPRSGSDGVGYSFAKALGHTITPLVMPALVPLVLEAGSFIRALSGLTTNTTLEVRSGTGKKLAAFTNSTLCTHFGLSGPGPLDVSRYYFDALHHDPAATLLINWAPTWTTESLDKALIEKRRQSPARLLTEPAAGMSTATTGGVGLPDRLARTLCEQVGIDAAAPAEHLPREARRALALAVTAMRVPVTESRGYTYAEVTAGGVPLAELHLATMSSRPCPGLHLCGELCDVDGRIGGFNFQWAWASGCLAGKGAVRGLGEAMK